MHGTSEKPFKCSARTYGFLFVQRQQAVERGPLFALGESLYEKNVTQEIINSSIKNNNNNNSNNNNNNNNNNNKLLYDAVYKLLEGAGIKRRHPQKC